MALARGGPESVDLSWGQRLYLWPQATITQIYYFVKDKSGPSVELCQLSQFVGGGKGVYNELKNKK